MKGYGNILGSWVCFAIGREESDHRGMYICLMGGCREGRVRSFSEAHSERMGEAANTSWHAGKSEIGTLDWADF